MAYKRGKQLRDGGEGYIYEVVGYPDLLMKIYKEKDIQGDPIVTPELHDKLKYMAEHPPENLVKLGQVAWPIELQYDNGKFVGFVMPRLNFDYQIQKIYSYKHPVLDQSEYESYPTYQIRIGVAINLCSIINELHRADYVIGDLNHENIGVDAKTGRISIVDVDSFHITNEYGQVLRTNVIMPGYLAPEIIKHCNDERAKGNPYNLDKVSLPTFSKKTDLFCLAIHIFKLLYNGVDPFRGVNVNVTGSNASPFIGNDAIERNAYVFRSGHRPSALFCPERDSLPPELFDLFNDAFLSGRNNPRLRPSAETWYHELYKFYGELVSCTENDKHQYYNQLYSCPFCKADEDYLAVQDPASVKVSINSVKKTPTGRQPPSFGSSTQQNVSQTPLSKPRKKKRWWVALIALLIGIPVFAGYYTSNMYSGYVRLRDNAEYNILFVDGRSEEIWYNRDYSVFDQDDFHLFSEDNSIISMNGNYLKAEKVGATTINVRSYYTECSDSETWYVLDWKAMGDIQLTCGSGYQLYALLNETVRRAFNNDNNGMQVYDILPGLVTFNSSDNNVVQVDDYGNVMALGSGRATITIKQGAKVLRKYTFQVN